MLTQVAVLTASSFTVFSLFLVAARSSRSRSAIVRFAPAPVLVPVRKKNASFNVDTELLSLRTLVETRCRSLFSDFNPLWWLPNGHLQTIYCVIGDFSKMDLIQYERKYIKLLDGGTLGLDFSPVYPIELANDVPIIVVNHGLTGGSYESYVRAILHRACTPTEGGGLGYRAVVVNFRGCAGVPITSPQMYSAGHTDDLRQALMFISNLYPKALLIGIGFSLGANVMIRYLAEEGHESLLVSGCALGCPWDLEKNSAQLSKSFVGKHMYSKGMGKNLKSSLKRHLHALMRYPEHPVAKAASLTLNLKSPTIDEFDDTFTRIAGGSAPNFPFDSAQDYYRWASSHHVLQDVRVPLLSINAADDPLVRNVPLDGANNGYVVMSLTSAGGHLGWFQGGLKSIDRWTTEPVLEWFEVIAEEVVHDKTFTRAKLYLDKDGFLKKEGNDFLGCKEMGGGGFIDTVRGPVGSLQGL